jgi:nucleoside-diphosphate-sugar epimerase
VHAAGVRRLVLVSSFGVYQWHRRPTTPVDEFFPRGDGGPYSNLTAAKEAVAEAYARRYGFELVVVRPASVFGVGHFSGGSSIGRRIQALLLAGLRAEPIVYQPWGTNEYVYADDLGRALDAAATAPLPSPSFINVGNGCLTSFASLLDVVQRASGRSIEAEVDVGEGGTPRSAPLDISAARRLLGWQPGFTLEQAVDDHIGQLRGLGPEGVRRLEH